MFARASSPAAEGRSPPPAPGQGRGGCAPCLPGTGPRGPPRGLQGLSLASGARASLPPLPTHTGRLQPRSTPARPRGRCSDASAAVRLLAGPSAPSAGHGHRPRPRRRGRGGRERGARARGRAEGCPPRPARRGAAPLRPAAVRGPRAPAVGAGRGADSRGWGAGAAPSRARGPPEAEEPGALAWGGGDEAENRPLLTPSRGPSECPPRNPGLPDLSMQPQPRVSAPSGPRLRRGALPGAPRGSPGPAETPGTPAPAASRLAPAPPPRAALPTARAFPGSLRVDGARAGPTPCSASLHPAPRFQDPRPTSRPPRGPAPPAHPARCPARCGAWGSRPRPGERGASPLARAQPRRRAETLPHPFPRSARPAPGPAARGAPARCRPPSGDAAASRPGSDYRGCLVLGGPGVLAPRPGAGGEGAGGGVPRLHPGIRDTSGGAPSGLRRGRPVPGRQQPPLWPAAVGTPAQGSPCPGVARGGVWVGRCPSPVPEAAASPPCWPWRLARASGKATVGPKVGGAGAASPPPQPARNPWPEAPSPPGQGAPRARPGDCWRLPRGVTCPVRVRAAHEAQGGRQAARGAPHTGRGLGQRSGCQAWTGRGPGSWSRWGHRPPPQEAAAAAGPQRGRRPPFALPKTPFWAPRCPSTCPAAGAPLPLALGPRWGLGAPSSWEGFQHQSWTLAAPWCPQAARTAARHVHQPQLRAGGRGARPHPPQHPWLRPLERDERRPSLPRAGGMGTAGPFPHTPPSPLLGSLALLPSLPSSSPVWAAVHSPKAAAGPATLPLPGLKGSHGAGRVRA